MVTCICCCYLLSLFFFIKQKTAYEMRISDWSSDVCSSDLWFSNRSVDPYTGETVLIDEGITPQDEKALGLQAYQEILQQEPPLPDDSEISRQVREIAERLVAKVPEVEDALAAEHAMTSPHIEQHFAWEVKVIPSEQVNEFCLPGGKIAV